MRLGIHGGFRGLRHSKCLLVIINLSGDLNTIYRSMNWMICQLVQGFCRFFFEWIQMEKKVEGDNTLAK